MPKQWYTNQEKLQIIWLQIKINLNPPPVAPFNLGLILFVLALAKGATAADQS